MAFSLDPSTTALIAIDMQRDFCCEDGYVSRNPSPHHEQAPATARYPS